MDATKLVRYEMIKEDFIAFNLHFQRTSRTAQAQRRKSMLTLVIAGLVLAAIPLQYPEARILWGGSLVLVLAACLIPSSLEKTVRKIVDRMLDEGRNKGLLGLKEITINPTEISSTGALRSGTTRWPAVEKIVTTDEALYVYVSSVEAIIIPRRAFEKPEEFEEFVGLARQYQAEAAARAK